MASYRKGRSVLNMVMVCIGIWILRSWPKVSSAGIKIRQHLIIVVFPLAIDVPLPCYAHLCGMSTSLQVQAIEGPVKVVIRSVASALTHDTNVRAALQPGEFDIARVCCCLFCDVNVLAAICIVGKRWICAAPVRDKAVLLRSKACLKRAKDVSI